MIETMELSPGVVLRCHRDSRFKQGCLSLQLLRPMDASEAAMNALLPSVLLRGSEQYPDLRAITLRLDDLYGASVSTLVRRIGDYQTTGFYCAFTEDRFAMAGDAIFAPLTQLLAQLLRKPVTEKEGFRREYVEGEKKNLISTIESERNDKRAYAAARLMHTMCSADPFGLPRLGTAQQVAAIDGQMLQRHHEKLLRESPVELFYVGSQSIDAVARQFAPLFAGMDRQTIALPAQTAFRDAGGCDTEETMELAQSQLCLGFTTPVTNRQEAYAAMQVLNTVFGAGMTSKLFMNVREKMSLCYSIGSGYYGTKGIITVSAGIDADKAQVTQREILAQLEACQKGDITLQELAAAKEAILSGLRGVHDSPGAIEGYYSTGYISGFDKTPESYRAAVEAVCLDDVVAAANTLSLHTRYFLKGVGA